MVGRMYWGGHSCGHCTAICLKGLRKLAKSRPRCEASTSGTLVCNILLGYFLNTNYLSHARTHARAQWPMAEQSDPALQLTSLVQQTAVPSVRTGHVCDGQSLHTSVSTVT